MSTEETIFNETADFEFAALNEARNYRSAIVREFAPYLSGRVLEIGAGIGQTCEAMAELPEVGELAGLEPDSRFHPGFRERLPETPLFEGTASDLVGSEIFDGIVMVNVLEHIEADEEELGHIRSLLRPGSGHLCILVPARPEIHSRLDDIFGHYRRYTRPRLEKAIKGAGLTPVKVCYFNFIGYFAWALRFRLLGSTSFDAGSVRLFDRWIFPAGHFLETKLSRPFIGQSLLAICRA